MFKVSARTILELGSELISSDIIAFYELIKNSFDAKTEDGVKVHFDITLQKNDYKRILNLIQEKVISHNDAILSIEKGLEKSSKYYKDFSEEIKRTKNIDELEETLIISQSKFNKLTISDSGLGMDIKQLSENFLVIGTSSRKKKIDEALFEKSNTSPFLGEKGIGRLSVMRLGNKLNLVTTTSDNDEEFILQIDWQKFSNLDLMLDEIEVKPLKRAKNKEWHGCIIEVSSLMENWTRLRVEDLVNLEMSKLTDPFEDIRKRPKIAVFWNNERISIPAMDKKLLDSSHAEVKGEYKVIKGKPYLKCQYTIRDAGLEHPIEQEICHLDEADLHGLIVGNKLNVSIDSLESLGDFNFECYWFNRQRLKAIDGIGTQKNARDLQKQWSGIMLYRDNFRVFPYGEDDDDWLSLDRKALAHSGYTLNKAQFIGRVNISRLGNPELIDQTNREGLRITDEQKVFLKILKFSIQERLLQKLKSIKKQYKGQKINVGVIETDITGLKKRADNAVKLLRKHVNESGKGFLEDLQQTLFQYAEFSRNAKLKIEVTESDSLMMTELAGIGLMSEIIAHELARTAENALDTLNVLKSKELSQEITKGLEILRGEMHSLNKRLKVLDPISIAGRQRTEKLSLVETIEDILDLHKPQFIRHSIDASIIEKPDNKMVMPLVKGILIQIFANLIANSKYWLDIKKDRIINFSPKIEIIIEDNPPTVFFRDNGTGISPENKENIFKPFFSLKEESKRRGLGLHIARENAAFIGCTLSLDNEINKETNRHHTFVLELPETDKTSTKK
ncbi:RstB [Pantoea ananatis LMG 20103]|uniref:RstB n=1 Tax=Pantoea ananatis (strain LMG 20103) TaxID=706191 RepID=D4GIU5_PANAM|nr:ATP-binding protein [Pantoea ananatis]ADD75690.1 RstB [Pantoea ananatis LMG 20103]